MHKKTPKNADNYVHAVRKGLTDNELELTSEIIEVVVDWVLSDEMENQLYDTAYWKEFHKKIHGEWHAVSKKLNTSMCQYAKGNVTSYQPLSFSVKSLHPYQATVMSKNTKASNDWFGFAKGQIALANSF